MGDGRFVAGTHPQAGNIMSREKANARKAELTADRQWVGRFLAGGAAERREMNTLDALIVGSR
jgi:hypothetical protein